MANLEYADVKQRIKGANSDVVDELYSFGEKLVSDAVDRLAKCDGKASALAAYSGALITLTMSTSTSWSKYLDKLSLAAVILAGLLFVASAWLAVGSTHPQPTEWYSDNDWLRSECLQTREQLKQYRVLTMWRILRSHQQAFRSKTKRIRSAVFALKIAFLLLVFAFLEVAWRYAPLKNLWIRIW
jgi:hypothetical protein